MKLLLLFLCSFLLANCSKTYTPCPVGFEGEDCRTQLSPKSIEVDFVNLTAFEDSRLDFDTSNDLYVTIVAADNNSILFSGGIQYNVLPSVTYGWSVPVELNPLSTYYIYVYESGRPNIPLVEFEYTYEADEGFPSFFFRNKEGFSCELHFSEYVF